MQSLDKHVVVLAGPGTGKTHTVIQKVKLLLTTNIKQKTGIIVCTYTKKAAEELKVRLFSSVNTDIIQQNNVLIGTIHSICYELLRTYLPDKYSDYEILSEDKQLHFIHSKLQNLGVPLCECNSKGWDYTEKLAIIFNEITDGLYDEKLFDRLNDELENISRFMYPIYSQLLQKNRFFDYASIQMTMYRELTTNDDFINQLAQNYQYIFVDEYQDVNRLQDLIVNELQAKMISTLVGDPNQSIYAFRGARPELFLNRLNNSSKIFHLNINYRSTQEITDICNILGTSANDNIKLIADKGYSGLQPFLLNFKSDVEEAGFYTGLLQAMYSNGVIHSYSEIAILFRSVKNHASAIIDSFTQAGIPCCIIGDGRFFTTRVGSLILSVSCILSQSKVKTKSDIDGFIRESNKERINIDPALLTDDNLVKIYELKQIRFHSAIGYVYDVLSKWNLFESIQAETYGYDIGTITQFAETYDDNSNRFDLFEFYNYLYFIASKAMIDRHIDSYNNQDGVRILTIHQAKGLEFPIVIMPSQNLRRKHDSLIEKFRSQIDKQRYEVDEDKHVFYVGVSRAIQSLFISHTEELKANKKKYKPVNEVLLIKSITSDNFDYDHFRSTYKGSWINPQQSSILLSYNQIQSYTICPQYYKFRHIWDLKSVRIAGQIYGNNVHRIVEIIMRKISLGVLIDNNMIKTIFDENWNDAAFRLDNQDYKKAAITQVTNLYNSVLSKIAKADIFSTEESFSYYLDDILVVGRFDLILRHSDKFEIVDYKSGDPRDYSNQLSFYNEAFFQKYGVYPTNLSIYFVKNGSSLRVKPSSPLEVRQKIKEIASNIRNGKFDPTSFDYCPDCAYNKICVFYRGI